MPNFFLVTAWFNEVRKDRIQWSAKAQKYEHGKIYSKDLGNVFIFGINTSILKE